LIALVVCLAVDYRKLAESSLILYGGLIALLISSGFGALTVKAVATPGHSPDSVCLLAGGICFTGDTVLGEGSVFISPDEGSLSAYLASLRRLRELELEVLCPGHGPYVWDPQAKLDEYIEHRLDRERRLLAALDAGLRSRDEILDSAWSDAPPFLRAAAELTLRAHLNKLAEEDRLPPGVEDY
jgi:glyoxylase-like metal-dependent hydrolase (beta-lactamase superfamily II)